MARTRLLRLALLALALVASAGAPASAQGWFNNLFGGFAPRGRSAPAYPGYGGGDGGGYGTRGGGGGGGRYAPSNDDYDRPAPPRQHVRKRKASPPKEDIAKEVPEPAKNASLHVYVFGDSLAQMLEIGLDDALADHDDVAVVHKARGSTGLVTTDFFDWPKSIDDLLAATKGDGKAGDTKEEKTADKDGTKAVGTTKETATRETAGKDSSRKDAAHKDSASKDIATKDSVSKPPKIDVAVMMIGSNDKQPIRQDGKTLSFGTPEWTAAYTKRVTAIDEAFRSHGVPLIWVGLPITKDDSFADAMASLNDITRDVAGKTGAVYVDTWEAFSDDDGDFSASGPDINGQTVRLRSSDGIHFTKAGARKLAHFVVAHVTRALDGKTPVPELPTAEMPDGGKPVAAAKPDAGPIRNLNEPAESKDGTLAALKGPARRDTLVSTTLVHGEAMPIPAGRADDARWPPQGAPEP